LNNIIELKNISRTYRNKAKPLTVLKDITLTIAAGEMVAIIGASGSGKSTLMNIMGCLDVADTGDYLVFGQNAAHLSPDELARLRREHIGFIFQRYHLLPDTTALSNVEMPAIYANSKRSERRLRARQFLARLGLAGREHHRPGELSGGEQQRVCIARALINGGEVILADEPTGALDSRSGQEVLQILTELNRLGHTVVIVTHDKEVAQYARRTIELKDGRIIVDSGYHAAPISPNNPLENRRGGTSPTKTFEDKLFVPMLARGGHKKPVHPTSSAQGYLGSLLDRTRESLRIALKTMNAHRMRTALTMTGIIFGIAAVVTVVALGEGAKQRTLENIKGLGTNAVNVYPGRDFSDTDVNVRPLVLSDVEALGSLSFVDNVSPEIFITSQPIRFRGKSANVFIEGVGRDYFRVEGIHLIEGSNFSDDRQAFQEVIIDEKTRTTFFDNDTRPLGQTIFLGSVPTRVIGVARNSRQYGLNQLTVWVPYTTAMYRMLGQQDLSSISVRIKENVSNRAAVDAIIQLLTQRHGVKDFKVFNREQIRQSVEHTSKTLNLLILMVAFISLVIGSLGVMNIMLVSVTERTHEIGVRVAVGARRSDILQQFLIEAILVCLIGGGLGIALSLALGPLFTSFAGDVLFAIYSWRTAIMAFICSTLIGILFGYLPARKAARMDPVVSLASE
jgi:macrolide transport system ATP-binding/permease protein